MWLLEEVAGRIARVRDYGFCPDLVRLVAEECGVPSRAVGYRYRPGIYRDPEHPGSSA